MSTCLLSLRGQRWPVGDLQTLLEQGQACRMAGPPSCRAGGGHASVCHPVWPCTGTVFLLHAIHSPALSDDPLCYSIMKFPHSSREERETNIPLKGLFMNRSHPFVVVVVVVCVRHTGAEWLADRWGSDTFPEDSGGGLPGPEEADLTVCEPGWGHHPKCCCHGRAGIARRKGQGTCFEPKHGNATKRTAAELLKKKREYSLPRLSYYFKKKACFIEIMEALIRMWKR